MLVFVIEDKDLIEDSLTEDKIRLLLSQAKSQKQELETNTQQKETNTDDTSRMIDKRKIPSDLKKNLELYLQSVNAGEEKTRYKLKYGSNGVKIEEMKTFRRSITEQLEAYSEVDLPLYFIKGVNKTAVDFINAKKQRFKEGVQLYEDLLNWTKNGSEESREIRAKLWFNLATAYQKGPEIFFEERKNALIAGFNESPEGSSIKDRVLNVINRDYKELVV